MQLPARWLRLWEGFLIRKVQEADIRVVLHALRHLLYRVIPSGGHRVNTVPAPVLEWGKLLAGTAAQLPAAARRRGRLLVCWDSFSGRWRRGLGRGGFQVRGSLHLLFFPLLSRQPFRSSSNSTP